MALACMMLALMPMPPAFALRERGGIRNNPDAVRRLEQDFGVPPSWSAEGFPEWPTRVPSQRSTTFDRALDQALQELRQAFYAAKSKPQPLLESLQRMAEMAGVPEALDDAKSHLALPANSWDLDDWRLFVS